MSYGQALRQARTQQGLTLEQVSASTRIRPEYLAALEDENLGALPERTYTRSFLQQYARTLKLAPAPLLAELEVALPRMTQLGLYPEAGAGLGAEGLQGGAAGVGAGRTLPPQTPTTPSNTAALLPLILGGLALLLGGGYFALRGGQNKTATTPPLQVAPAETPRSQSVNLSVSSIPSGATVYLDNRNLGETPLQSFPVEARKGAVLRVEADGRLAFKQTVDLRTPRNLQVRLMPAGLGPSLMKDIATGRVQESQSVPPPKAPPVPVKGVTVKLSADSWMRVTASGGRILFEGMAPAGTTKTYDKGVTVRAGNAAAVQVSVDGSDPTAMGADGQVVTRSY